MKCFWRVLFGTAAGVLFAMVEIPLLGRFAALDAATALASPATPAVDELTLEETIPPGDVKGRIDHMAIDARRKRLFVAELGNDSIAVVDLHAHRLEQRITGFKEPQASHMPPRRIVFSSPAAGQARLIFAKAMI